MTSPEGDAFHFGHERVRRANGLIGEREGFEFPLPDIDVMRQFEYRWQAYGRQRMVVGSELRRLDHYFENGKEHLSVVKILAIDSEGVEDCEATTYMIYPDGTSKLERHPSREKDGEILWEPAEGDETVQPAGFDGYLLFCHTAYDSELLKSA